MYEQPRTSISKSQNRCNYHPCDRNICDTSTPQNPETTQKTKTKVIQEDPNDVIIIDPPIQPIQPIRPIKPIKNQREILFRNVEKLQFNGAETFGGIQILNKDTCVSIFSQDRVQLMVSSTFGKGKAIAFSNDEFFGDFFVRNKDWIIFLRNIIQHVSRKTIRPTVLPITPIKILFTSTSKSFINVINSLKRAYTQIQITYQCGFDQVDLSAYDCIFLHDLKLSIFSEEDCNKVIEYVRNGGGIVTALRGWVFKYYGEGMFMKDWEQQCFYNQILIPMGLKFNQNSAYIQKLVLNPQDTIELPQLPLRPYKRQQYSRFDPTPLAQLDKREIIEGLSSISFGYNGHYGNSLSYLDDNYRTVLRNRSNDLCVAGRVGKGKIFAMGHASIYNQDYTKEPTYKKFLKNIVRWMCDSKTSLKIGLLHQKNGQWPQNFSFNNIGRDIVIKNVDKWELLEDLDIVCGTYYSFYPKTMTSQFNSKVKQFVRNGGNFFFASYGWVWEAFGQYQQNKSLIYEKDFASYVLLKQFNIFLDKKQFNLASPTKIITYIQDPEVFNFLKNNLLEVLQNNQKTNFTATEQQINEYISAIESIEPNQFQMICSFDLYHRIVDSFVASRFNIEKNYDKLSFADPFICKVFNLMNKISYACPPQHCRALPPSLNVYPGFATKKIAQKTIQVYRSQNKLVFTGLYLNPGEVVRVSHNHQSKDISKVELKINLNFDLSLYNNGNLRRFTDIAYTFKIKSKQFLIASPHGGIIYFDVQKSNNKDRRPLTFKFQDAYEAPYWKQNKTEEDFEEIQKIDAPFIIIETQRINLISPTFKSLHTQKIDIKRLCNFWNTVIGYYKDYRGSQQYPFHKQAIFCDVSTIAGYMHAGNPIMAHEDLAFQMIGVGKKIFYAGTWGFFHQIGHNHQDSKWTLNEMGQVTCNIYSLYLIYKMYGTTLQEYIFRPQRTQNVINKFFQNPDRTLSDYGSDPYLGMIFFAIIMDEFGYEVFSKVHKNYDNIKMEETSNQYKVDVLVQQVSIVTNTNFWFYFKNWAMPVTQRSLAKIGNLKKYFCKRYPFMTKQR